MNEVEIVTISPEDGGCPSTSPDEHRIPCVLPDGHIGEHRGHVLMLGNRGLVAVWGGGDDEVDETGDP